MKPAFGSNSYLKAQVTYGINAEWIIHRGFNKTLFRMSTAHAPAKCPQ